MITPRSRRRPPRHKLLHTEILAKRHHSSLEPTAVVEDTVDQMFEGHQVVVTKDIFRGQDTLVACAEMQQDLIGEVRVSIGVQLWV